MKAPLSLIIHNASDALGAAEASQKVQCPVDLYSARDAAKSLGPEVFILIISAAKMAFPKAEITGILDCGQDAGTALTALRRGAQEISVDLPVATREKIEDIAAQSSARIRDYPKEVLDLGKCWNPEQTVLSLLMEHQQNE